MTRAGRAWKGLGVFIGRHMVVIVLCCLAAGILLPQAFATLLASPFASPFAVPLTLHLLFGTVVEVNALGMVLDMLYMVVVPSVVGIVVNEATHGLGTRTLSASLMPLARLMLVVIIATNSSAISDFVFHLTPQLAGVLVFVGLFASFNFLMGAALAYVFRQRRERAVAMLFQPGMRNISAGAVLAMQYFPPASLFAVMAGVLFQQVLAALFGSLLRRLRAGRAVRVLRTTG